MNIERFENEAALSAALATRVLDRIAAQPELVIGLPTGRTPLGLYRELRERSAGTTRLKPSAPADGPAASAFRRAAPDWSRVRTFNLDEFAGLGAQDPNSYRAYMQTELFDHVSIAPGHIEFLNGRARDLREECRRYEEAIGRVGGIDLQILGIGANGHIGFNEPATGLCAHTHLAELEQETRASNAQRFGGDWRNVPERALSMGMATILGAEQIVLIATGPEKADAVRGMIEGLITSRLPASLLQVHRDVTVMVDGLAWSG